MMGRNGQSAAKPPRSGATRWSRLHALNRILRLLPMDCRPEAREVLEALMREGETDSPTAALLYLFREFKAEVLCRAEALRVARAAPDAGEAEICDATQGMDGSGISTRERRG